MTSFGSPWRDPVVTGPRLLVRISVGYPTDHEFYFTDGAVVDSGFGTGTASVGQATTAFIGKISPGTESEEGFTVVLRNVKPYADNANTDLIYTDLVHLFTYYVFEGATAYLYQYADSIVASDDRTVLIGTVESVTDLTPSTVTVKISEDNLNRTVQCTRHTVGGIGWPVDDKDVPPMSKGLALPLRLGPTNYKPRGFQHIGDAQAYDLVESGHIRAALVPCRLQHDNRENGGGLVYASQEKTSGLVTAYGQYGLTAKAMLYNSGTDTFGRFMVGAYSNDSQATTRGWYYVTTGNDLELIMDLVPKTWSYVNPTYVTGPGNAIDGRPDTYTAINVPSSQLELPLVRYRIPSIGQLGGIWPASGYIRVRLFVLSYQPPGEPAAPSGYYRLGIKHPYGSPYAANWISDHVPDYLSVPGASGWQASMFGASHYPISDIWIGTKWQRWDFTAHGSNASEDKDRVHYPGAESDAGIPQELVITNRANVGAVLYVVGVALQVRFKLNREDPFVIRNLWAPSITDSLLEWIKQRIFGKSSGWWRIWIPWDTGESGSGYELGAPVSKAAHFKAEPDAPEAIWLHHPGYYDGSDTYGSGGGWIETPGAIINYIATAYGGRGFSIGNSTTWGTVKWFDAMMAKWSAIHHNDVTKFRLFYWQHDQGSVREMMDRIFAELPGLARTGITPAGIASLICTTHSLVDESIPARHACVTSSDRGITLSKDILTGQDGALSFEQTRSPASQIVNEIEVHYQYDQTTGRYGAIAKCSASSSDDGFGFAWPTIGGYPASEICGLSQSIYTGGVPNKKVIQLKYHWYSETAVAVGLWYLMRYWRPYVMVRFNGALSCQDIMPGQLITFNDELRTTGGMGCSIPFLNDNKWYKDLGGGIHTYHNFHVLSNTRISEPYPGRGVHYEVIAMEHLSIQPAPGALTGGPVIAGEGFDGIL